MKKMAVSIIVILFLSLLAFIGLRFLMINTKDSVVDAQKFLGNQSNTAAIYAASSNGLFYSPVNIDVAEMDKLMLIDVEDDPEYASIELQTFDDTRGQGARVILYHHQGPADFYYTDSSFVMQDSKDKPFFIAPDMTYHFDVMPSGLDASLKMQDKQGKSIAFRVKETSRKKWSKGFLAPIGGSDAITFPYFPFFHMKNMNFVSRSGTEISVQIGDEARTPKKLPIPVDREFVYLSRYTAAPIICCWNKPHDSDLQPFNPVPSMEYQDGQTHYELINNAGHYEISSIVGSNHRHQVDFEFSPPIPDLPALKDGIEIKGRFCAGADETPGIVAGEYTIIRHGNRIDMEIQPQKGWQPMPGTSWVKSWTWESTIAVDENNTVSMKSKWIRKK